MATYTVDKIAYGGNTYNLQDAGALQLTGGSVTGPVTFGDSVSIDDLSVGTLSTTGNATFANNIQANKINNVTVGSSPKFTDTITTVSTTGSGNAITSITASNGAITATKGSTFLTSAPVTSVNGKTGAVTLSIPTVPTNVSAFTNDAGYITSGAFIVNITSTGTDSYSSDKTAKEIYDADNDGQIILCNVNSWFLNLLGSVYEENNYNYYQATFSKINSDTSIEEYLVITDNNITTVTRNTYPGSIPKIQLNNITTNSPSFYAPTTVGTSGQYLKSNGSDAPSWTNFPTIPTIKLNNTNTTAATFYAPTAGGTSGYYLKGNGTTAAPTWEAWPASTSTIASTTAYTKNISASTWYTFKNFTLAAGTWIVQCTCTFTSTSTKGTRIIRLTTGNTSTTRVNWNCEATMGTHDNSQNVLTFTTILKPTASTTYYLRAWSSVAIESHASNNSGTVSYVKLV